MKLKDGKDLGARRGALFLGGLAAVGVSLGTVMVSEPAFGGECPGPSFGGRFELEKVEVEGAPVEFGKREGSMWWGGRTGEMLFWTIDVAAARLCEFSKETEDD